MTKTCKKLISFLLAVVTVFALTSLSVSAFTSEDEIFDCSIVGDGKVKIINYDQSSKNVVIPETVKDGAGKTYTVVSIDSDTFGDVFGAQIVSLSIPGTIKTIAGAQFQNFASLESVTLGEGVETIGSSAFSNCASLESINIPDSVKTIGAFAFGDCSALEEVTIGSGVTEIPSTAFDRCSSLSTVYLGYNTESVAETAFRGCSSLSKIYAYDKLESFPLESIDFVDVKFYCYPDSEFYDFLVENEAEVETYTLEKLDVDVTDSEEQVYAESDSVTLRKDGLKVQAIYEDAPARDVLSKCTLSTEDDFSTPGDKTVTVSYGGKTATYTAKVFGLSKLVVTVDAEKQKYAMTDSVTLHKDGLKVVADYVNADDVDVTTECTLSTEDDFSTPGDKTVTVSYGGKTATYTAKVFGLSKLVVTVDAEKQKYAMTDSVTLHKDGLKVVADYVNADDVDVTTECTLSTEDDFSTPGDKTVTVSYGGKTATYTVKVFDFSFSGNPANVTINYKDAYRFTLLTTDMPEDAKIVWSTSNPKVLTVDQNGNLKTLKRGTATITAKIEGTDISVSCNVTVKYTWWQWILIIVLFGWIWYR